MSTPKKKTKKCAPSKAAKTVKPSGGASVVVASRIKEIVSKSNLRSESCFVDAVSKKVIELINKACASAVANKRGTVRGFDL